MAGDAAPYWLETPYAGNSGMVRMVDVDGYVYHKEASVDRIGIVPVICVRLE